MKKSSNKQGGKGGKAYATPRLVVFGQIATVTQQTMMGAFADGGTMMNMLRLNPIGS
jgi:hypothetical protein